MSLVTTSGAQDSTIRKAEGIGDIVADVLGIVEDLDTRLAAALDTITELRSQVESLEDELREARDKLNDLDIEA